MKLRNRLGYLNVLPEERPKRKLSSILIVLVYFSLLGSILLYLIFYGLSGFFHVTARGHVELSKYFVQTDRSGKIDRYLVRPEERVVRGQPLFVIRSDPGFTLKGGVITRSDLESRKARLASLEKVLTFLEQEETPLSGWSTDGASENRELVRVTGDIKFIQSKLHVLNEEIERKRTARADLSRKISGKRVQELETFAKSVIRKQSGVGREVGKLEREINRREIALRVSRDSLSGWKEVARSLEAPGRALDGVLISRELIRVNNDIEARKAALSLAEQQIRDKRESLRKLKTGFSEARILELGGGRGARALEGDIDNMLYKVADLKNRVDSLIHYRKDLVMNEINSLKYEIKASIKKIVELRKHLIDSGQEYKVIAKELGFVSLGESIKELNKKKSVLETKLRSKRKLGVDLVISEIEKLRYSVRLEQEEKGQGDGNPWGGSDRFGALDGDFVTSPVEGSVVLLYRREGEYAAKGDILLSVRENDAKVKVKVFFKTRDLASIQTGKEVTVRFPDKIESPGVIENFYSSRYRNTGASRSPAVVPPEIVVEITPLNSSGAALWEKYDQLEVSVKVRK